MVGELAVHQPLGEGEAVRGRVRRERVQEGGNARGDDLGGLQEVAPHEHVGLARLLPLVEHELGRAFGMLGLEGGDGLVGLLPLGYGGPPVGEDRLLLRGRALVLRQAEGDAHRGGQGIGHRPRSGGDGEAEPPQVVVLVVVAVPAAVVLLQVEIEDRASLVTRDRRLGHEHRLAGLVAQPRAHVDAPGRLVLSVDGEGDGPGHAPALRFVVEDGREGRFLRVDVGGGASRSSRGWACPARSRGPGPPRTR